MIDCVDRIQVVVSDRRPAAQAWSTLLDAAVLREDRVAALGCRRTVLGAGVSEVELLEAEGPGPVRDAGPGLFAAGFGTRDPDAVRSHLEKQGVALDAEGEQLFVAGEALGGPQGSQGLRVVVSPARKRERIGLLERLYEVTNLVADAGAWTKRFALLFGLDAGAFVPIRSEAFGYEGALTLFDPGDLDRIEIINPYERGKTMGRYFTRRGPSLYMCYGESDRSAEIRDRAREHAADGWTGPAEGGAPDNLFLHHTALAGVMMGLSRTTYAWTWSGSPDRVEPA